MRIDQLELTEFGPFAHTTINLSSGLTLIYGENEAGKSSLLRAVRAALFGATSTKLGDKTVRTLDGWAGARPSTSIAISATLSDGEQLEFTRTNKTKTPVVGQHAGQAFDANGLTSLLGIDATQYRNVFGFTLDELRAGQQSLTEASVTEVLFGGGLGRLASFRELQNRVAKLSGDLFKVRGKNQPVNAKLADVHSVAKQLRDKIVTPQSYETQTAELAALQSRVDQLEAKLAEVRKERFRLDRLDEASELFRDLRHAEAERAAIGIETPFTESDAREVLALHAEQARVEQERNQLTATCQTLEAELAAIELHPEVESATSEISELSESSALVREKRHEIGTLNDQWQSISNELSQLEKAATPLPETAKPLLVAWQNRDAELCERSRQITADLTVAKRQLAESKLVAVSTPENDSQEFAILAAADRWQTCEQNLPRKDKLQRLVESDEARLDELKKRANNMVGLSKCPSSLNGLLAASVVRERSLELDRLQSKQRGCVDHSADLRTEQKRLLDELDSLAANPTLVTTEQVRSAREIRDETLDHLPNTVHKAIETKLTDDFESSLKAVKQSVSTADGLSDRLTANAQEAAREAVLQRQLTHAERDLKEAVEAEAISLAQIDSWNEQWAQEWDGVFSDPPSPAVCEDWLSLVEQIANLTHGISTAKAEYQSLRNAHDDAAEEIKRLIPESHATEDLRSQVAWLKVETVSTRDKHGERRRAREQQPAKERVVQELEDAQNELSHQRAALNEEFETWKTEHSVPAEKTFIDLETQLYRDEQVHQLQRQLSDVESRRKHATTLVEEFDNALQALNIQDDALPNSPHERVSELASRVQLHHEGTQLANSTRRSQHDSNSRAEALDKLIATNSERLEQLCLSQQGESDSSLLLLAEKSLAYWNCDNNVRMKQQMLKIAAGEIPLEILLDELEASDAAFRSEQRATIQESLDTFTAERQDALDCMAVIRNSLATLSDGERLSTLQTQLESDRAELRDAIDSYAPLLLLQTMLDRAIETFGRSVRPELLDSLAEIFRELTGGEYIEVDRSLEAESMRVQHVSEKWKSPAELSTGTRELLYLAVRLAFLQERARSHESLPIFMDDVLVNIDGKRTKAVISTLSKLAQQMQIVVLTCRDDLPRAFEQAGEMSAVRKMDGSQFFQHRESTSTTAAPDDSTSSQPHASELLF